MQIKNKKNHETVRRVFDILLITGFAVTLIILISMGVKVTQGVAETVEKPQDLIRLQILNGSIDKAKPVELINYLTNYNDSLLEIELIETGNFDLYPVSKSFIINRSNTEAAAKTFGKIVGLENEPITPKTLDYNQKHISLTLVLGDDYREKIISQFIRRSEKESIE